MKEEKLTDEQLWQLCIDEENKKKTKIKTRLKNEDESIDLEFWSKEFEKTKGLK
jgi:hypothetical protein